MVIDACGDTFKSPAKKIVGDIAGDEEDGERDLFGVGLAVSAAEHQVQDQHEGKWVEDGPHKAKKIADVFLFKVPQAQIQDEHPVPVQLVKKINGFKKKLPGLSHCRLIFRESLHDVPGYK